MTANKILIIDDEEAIVRLLSMSLRSDGYTTFTACSGEQGIEVFKTEAPDIVITDIKMPGMDGLEVLRRVKEMDPGKEVIIVTGHGDIDSTITALQRGASDFINKPVRDEALSIALERAKEKIRIREQLARHTEDLENKVREATELIRRRANFLRLLIRSSNDGIVGFDNQWKVVIFNPEAALIFEYQQADVINKMTIEDLCTPVMVKLFKERAMKQEVSHTEPWQETVFRTRGGRDVPLRFSSSVLYENDEMVGSVNFFQDITEIKRLEKELVQSERLAAMGQTVSGLAHYIKNILIGLKGGSYVVDVGLKKDNITKLKDGWKTIKKNIERTSDLVQNLLTYSKEREPEFQACFPNDIVKDAADLVTDYAKNNQIDIVTELDPRIGEVIMDPETVHRSLLNLLTNGIEACLDDENMDKTWQVSVKTALEDDHRLCIEIRDNGSGMSKETRNKLFTPLFSSKGGKGTGLGLLVTRKLIEEHKGSIDVESQLGQGTTFTLRLPFETVNHD
ncbi:MAG: response regulator [Pseudomonadota bacterium]